MFELPEFTPNITRDFLLSKNSEETYMSTYLKIPIKRGLQVSPLRADKRPTAHFYRNKRGTLIFHDFGTGFNGDFISVVMELYKCTYKEALNTIAKDFGYKKQTGCEKQRQIIISPVTITEKKDTSIQVEQKEFSEKELQWWGGFGITQPTLKKFNIYSCKSVFLNGNYLNSSDESNPIFGYYGGKKEGTELWRIYYPKRRAYRFISNWSNHFIQGSKQLPSDGNTLVITKSLKDCAALYEFGLSAIAPCSENQFLTDNQLDRLKVRFKNIVVFYDNDLPGIHGLNRIKKKHPELMYLFIPKEYKAKDFSDLVKGVGVKKTTELINHYLEYYGIEK